MQNTEYQPLAARMRPRTIAEYIGQEHLLGVGKPLRYALEHGVLHSMILWGPPGTGKTTLAKLLAECSGAHFETISAVLAGVKEIREVVTRAREVQQLEQRQTVLFVDEVHRFNKAQQDAFLPMVEDGLVTLIGATTENPSFSLNNALLSRARVYILKRLNEDNLLQIVQQALQDKIRGLGNLALDFAEPLQRKLVQLADGDARQVLNLLELIADYVQVHQEQNGLLTITEELLSELFAGGLRKFDKGGEYFYDQISALHKAVRGSNPDAALYWFARMLDGGCEPRYLARRLIRMASEDIGNADPRALPLVMSAAEAYEHLGSPEGDLALAQAVIYLAVAPKSNACEVAYLAAMAAVRRYGSLDVPLHLRNAPTKLMKELGYGKNYRYAHDEPNAYAAGENYFPDGMPQEKFYRPVNRGLEIKIAEKLAYLKELDRKAKNINN